MNAHDVVSRRIVKLRPPKDFMAQLEPMNVVDGFVQHFVTEVKEEFPQLDL
jgi:hypothetical protein